MRIALKLASLLIVSLALVACRDPARAAGTAALVEATFDAALEVDQLAFELRDAQGSLLDEVRLPESAAEPLSSPQTLRWLLPDSYAGSILRVAVRGLADGVEVASGEASEQILRGYEVGFEVQLQPPAGADAGRCGATDFAACGTTGPCVACDPNRADRCEGGSCRCGTEAPCGAGQRCAGGLCVCDATSCPAGCCDGTTCQTRSLASCGTPGSTCIACNTTRADTCSASGACTCGVNDACASGQRCLGGSCVCDSTSCPTGCCAMDVCKAGDAKDECGTGGQACQACSALSSCVSQSCL